MRTRWNWPRTTKRGCSNTVGAELAGEHKPFYTSLLDGTPRFSGLGGGAVSHGKLPEEYHEAVDAAEYVVYSYETPIGWVNADDSVTIPDVGYSLTTGQHQYELIHAWRDRLPRGFTIAARGRRIAPAGGGRRNGGMDDPYPPARYNGPGRGTVARAREEIQALWSVSRQPGTVSGYWTTEDDARLDRVAADLADLRRQMQEQEANAHAASLEADAHDRRNGRRERRYEALQRRAESGAFYDGRAVDPAGQTGYDRTGLPIDPQWDGGL